MKRFADLSEQEVLALAISNEDEDNRIYRSFADGLRSSYPDTASLQEALQLQNIAVYSKRATGEKYLINPNKSG